MNENEISGKLDELDRKIDALNILIENTVCGKLQILAEGHTTILETLTPKTKTQELEEEVEFLKAVIKAHAKQIAELEKKLA